MTKVALIEDNQLYSQVLSECLKELPDVEVVRVLDSEESALAWIESGGPEQVQCVMVDLQLPRRRGDREISSSAGIRLIRTLRHEIHFAGSILILSSSRSVADGQKALAAGCDGYLYKSANLPEMLKGLLAVLRGEVMVVTPELRHVFFRHELSVKEVRLMEMVDQGKSWAEVAEALGYRSARAASIIGYRVFDKLAGKSYKEKGGKSKREWALQLWRARSRRTSE